MDTTTIANVDPRTACDATPAALRRRATAWERGHAATSPRTTGGVRLDAPATRLRGGVDARAVRSTEGSFAPIALRSTVPSWGTTPTGPPV